MVISNRGHIVAFKSVKIIISLYLEGNKYIYIYWELMKNN